MRVGLVLGAGGITGGAFHAGVLAAIADATGWDPRTADVIVGTSAGSIAGASLRAGLHPRDMLARATGRPISPEGRRLLTRVTPPPASFPLRPQRGAGRRGPAAPEAIAAAARRPWRARPLGLAAALMPAGTMPTAMITDGIAPLVGSKWPTEPLWLVALRLSDGRRMVFGRDDDAPSVPLPLAAAASCAIPGFFQPVEVEGQRYVDGGAHSPTNLDLFAGAGFDLVVVSSPMSVAGRGLALSADAAVRRACRAMLDAEAVRVRRRGTKVIAFQPTPDDRAVMGINAMDPSRRSAVAEQAYRSTRKRLERADVQERLAPLSRARA